MHRRRILAQLPYHLLAVIALLGALAVGARAKPVVQKLPGRGSVNWTRGVILAEGAASADLQAPRARIARVRAERIARERATAKLAEQARALPVAAGGTVGERLDADEVARRRFDRAVARALDERVDYDSDGSVNVVLALPVEAVRSAVHGPSAAPEEDEPTALLIVATSVMKRPEVGVGIRGRDGEYSGATVFYRDKRAAAKDPRLGEVVARHTATERDGAFLVVNADLAVGKAQPVVVVVIGK